MNTASSRQGRLQDYRGRREKKNYPAHALTTKSNTDELRSDGRGCARSVRGDLPTVMAGGDEKRRTAVAKKQRVDAVMHACLRTRLVFL